LSRFPPKNIRELKIGTMFKENLLSIILVFLAISCSKEEVGKQGRVASFTTPQRVLFDGTNCAQHTEIRPKVDFLFLFDNSTSTNYLNPQTIASLEGVFSRLPDHYDYHAMVAPLLDNGKTNHPVLVRDVTHSVQENGLNLSKLGSRLKGSAYEISPFTNQEKVGGAYENGFERAYDLINNEYNKGTNVFRKDSYIIITVISNGDDNAYLSSTGGLYYPHLDYNDFEQKKSLLLSLKNVSNLNAIKVRFLSLVANKPTAFCSGARDGDRYRRMSKHLHDLSLDTVSNSSANPDTFDICSDSVSDIFSQLDQIIHYVVVPHRYEYWQVTTNTNQNAIDPSTIEVFKSSTGEQIPESYVNGFSYQYVSPPSTRNTRYYPDYGEPKSGHLIQLYGTARIEYPECLRVKTQTPLEYWAYIVLDKEPDLSDIKVTIDGNEIPQSSTNGWQYIGRQDSINIRVKSLSNPIATSEPDKTMRGPGWFLKLSGSAIYSNNSRVEVRFSPKSQ
jgi:hypothetical protein